MKVEIELNRNDLFFFIFIVGIIAGAISYYVYRETNIRTLLVEQAKSEEYGKGISDQIKRRFK